MGEFIFEVVNEDASGRDREAADLPEPAFKHFTDHRKLHMQRRGQVSDE
jgi:hypothetical protein